MYKPDDLPPLQRRQRQAQWLRVARKIHRWTGASLFLLFVVVAITGLMLGWKKNSGGYLLPATARGLSADAAQWQTLDQLQQRAAVVMDSLYPGLSAEVDRMDVRPDRGVVKFVFTQHYTEIQLDCTTGALLSASVRRSDFLEQLHDGTVVDRKLGTGFFKLFYTSLMGLALLTFSITGFWLWYGPKRMRHANR